MAKVSDWISVKERMPEASKHNRHRSVLVFVRYKFKGHVIEPKKPETMSMFITGWGEDQYITHWRPSAPRTGEING